MLLTSFNSINFLEDLSTSWTFDHLSEVKEEEDVEVEQMAFMFPFKSLSTIQDKKSQSVAPPWKSFSLVWLWTWFWGIAVWTEPRTSFYFAIKLASEAMGQWIACNPGGRGSIPAASKIETRLFKWLFPPLRSKVVRIETGLMKEYFKNEEKGRKSMKN